MKTIAVDFDGVIHSYTTSWTTSEQIPDPPVPGALDFIREALLEFNVVIFSVRADSNQSRKAIRNWFLWNGMEQELLDKIIITDQKPKAIIYLDDRGWRFDGVFPTVREIREFKPWNRK